MDTEGLLKLLKEHKDADSNAGLEEVRVREGDLLPEKERIAS